MLSSSRALLLAAMWVCTAVSQVGENVTVSIPGLGSVKVGFCLRFILSNMHFSFPTSCVQTRPDAASQTSTA